jgi:hypothetical protein
MTEAEWLACDNPASLLQFVTRTFLDAHRRLLLTSCGFYWNSIGRWVPVREQTLLEAIERYADDRVNYEEYEQLSDAVYGEHGDCSPAASLWLGTTNPLDRFHHEEHPVPNPVLANTVRCIFGNPFRPVTLDPSWRTSTVLALAEGIYTDRAFDRLPILADALQDAGCENDAILSHCRGLGPHVRGCWVVDLILGKA